MQRVKAIVYGVGAMGKIVTRLLLEKGVHIVGAIDANPDIVGRDLGAAAGIGRELGVTVRDDADEVLAGRQADIAIVSVASFMETMYPILARCAAHGVNVVTIAEEALYPWLSSPELTASLDRLARENRVTITGTGQQDTYWVNLIATLAGTAHRIDKISGLVSWNVDDYGAQVARDARIGDTVAAFHSYIEEHGWPPSFARNSLECVVSSLGLSISKIEERTEPEVAEEDRYATSLALTVPAGDVIGHADIITIETHQGITLEMKMIGRLFAPDETDVNEWNIEGEPAIHLRNDDVNTQFMTCTQAVNRIPDVINAPPGYVTVEKLPALRYRAYPLGVYVAEGKMHRRGRRRRR